MVDKKWPSQQGHILSLESAKSFCWHLKFYISSLPFGRGSRQWWLTSGLGYTQSHPSSAKWWSSLTKAIFVLASSHNHILIFHLSCSVDSFKPSSSAIKFCILWCFSLPDGSDATSLYLSKNEISYGGGRRLTSFSSDSWDQFIES